MEVTPNLLSTRDRVIALRTHDQTLRATHIAKMVGVSRERVRQILSGEGLSTKVPFTSFAFCEDCNKRLSTKSRFCKVCFMKSRRMELVCMSCGTAYQIRKKEVETRRARGYKLNFCSRRCLGAHAGHTYGFGVHRNRQI